MDARSRDALDEVLVLNRNQQCRRALLTAVFDQELTSCHVPSVEVYERKS